MRNIEVEKEVARIAIEIWESIGNKEIPKIESKQGGASGSYYPREHKISIRWNVWDKLNIVGKRLLIIHELIHATGQHHKGIYGYMHGSDILSQEIYKLIYGNIDISPITEIAVDILKNKAKLKEGK